VLAPIPRASELERTRELSTAQRSSRLDVVLVGAWEADAYALWEPERRATPRGRHVRSSP